MCIVSGNQFLGVHSLSSSSLLSPLSSSSSTPISRKDLSFCIVVMFSLYIILSGFLSNTELRDYCLVVIGNDENTHNYMGILILWNILINILI